MKAEILISNYFSWVNLFTYSDGDTMENQILVPMDNTEKNEDIIKLADEYGHDIQAKYSFCML